MNESAYERLMMLLASDGLNDPCRGYDAEDPDIDEAVIDAASVIADLAEAGSDWVGAAVWQQVAVDAGRAGDGVACALSAEPWIATDDESEIYPHRWIK
jgi:hypothetical protein